MRSIKDHSNAFKCSGCRGETLCCVVCAVCWAWDAATCYKVHMRMPCFGCSAHVTALLFVLILLLVESIAKKVIVGVNQPFSDADIVAQLELIERKQVWT
eukprot:m.227907 g.227907  ORF g.227907 m.227907 type:complete len:100 (+) comp15184_c0_seq17:46-345(+)